MKTNYYQTLEIAQTATAEEIKKAYRRLSKKYHPDANPGNQQAQERFQEISEAYAVLSDEKKRKEYDVQLQNASRQQEQAKRQNAGGQGSRRKPENQEFDINHMSKSFERFFGFHPKTGEINEEQLNRNKKKSANPLDVSDLFEKYMGIRK